MTANDKMWTVSEVNRLVKDVLEQSFYPFWVEGEVSNLTIHRSGHVYFTLKDERSQLSAVFFRGAQSAREMGLEEGLRVEAYGRLGAYEPRGVYQIVVSRLRLKGKGDLQKRFEELKRKLRDEGLFDEDRKRVLPALPRCIGVVTSPQGAAIRDFLQILQRRVGGMHVRIYPAAVQGESAAVEIVRGLAFFNARKACDVIVLTRGGGSLEDLWPFNEEKVARAVVASGIPVMSAVGHEVDYTICDFAADVRAPTPSAAAELVMARKAELTERIATLQGRLRSILNLQLVELKRRVERAAGSYVFREPRNIVQTYQQRVDDLTARSLNVLSQRMQLYTGRLEKVEAQLNALGPRRVLERGYSILMTRDGRGAVVVDAAACAAGDRLRGILAKGELDLTIESCTLETGSVDRLSPVPNSK